MNITEEAALVARDCKSPSRKIPSPSGLILFKVPEEISETEIEETGSYEPDPDMPPLNSAEPSKQVFVICLTIYGVTCSYSFCRFEYFNAIQQILPTKLRIHAFPPKKQMLYHLVNR